MRTVTTPFGDELTEADFDGYKSRAYKRKLIRHPDCRDPDHPGCSFCEEDSDPESDGADSEAINEEPIPYYANKEA